MSYTVRVLTIVWQYRDLIISVRLWRFNIESGHIGTRERFAFVYSVGTCWPKWSATTRRKVSCCNCWCHARGSGRPLDWWCVPLTRHAALSMIRCCLRGQLDHYLLRASTRSVCFPQCTKELSWHFTLQTVPVFRLTAGRSFGSLNTWPNVLTGLNAVRMWNFWRTWPTRSHVPSVPNAYLKQDIRIPACSKILHDSILFLFTTFEFRVWQYNVASWPCSVVFSPRLLHGVVWREASRDICSCEFLSWRRQSLKSHYSTRWFVRSIVNWKLSGYCFVLGLYFRRGQPVSGHVVPPERVVTGTSTIPWGPGKKPYRKLFWCSKKRLGPWRRSFRWSLKLLLTHRHYVI